MAKKDNLPVKKNPVGQMKETRCIYIPSQPVKNIMPGCDYKIILGSMREIIFYFNLKSTNEITIEIDNILSYSQSVQQVGVYDIQTKKLVTGKFKIKSGISYRVQVSRFFSATFVAKANGRVIGKYTPKLMDPKNYGQEATVWIEPMYIGFSETATDTRFMQMLQQHETVSQKWLGGLPQFNTPTKLAPAYPFQNIRESFSNVCNAPLTEHAAVLFYRPKKGSRTSWREYMEITVWQAESLLNREDFDELVKVVSALSDPDDAAVLNGLGFTKDNRHWDIALTRKIQIRWVRGYLAIVFKGQNPPFNFTHAGLAHEKLKGMSGGMHIRKGKRIQLQISGSGTKNAALKVGRGMLNTAKQIKGPFAAAGLLIDFVGDYEKVMMDENGSREIGELLGRAGSVFWLQGQGLLWEVQHCPE